jgi:Do/DeqQ family serine protease
MGINKLLFSKRFFIANLLVAGLVIGFVAAGAVFLLNGATVPARMTLGAESPKELDPGVKASLDEARKVQGAFQWVAGQIMPVVVELKVTEKDSGAQNDIQSLPWRFFFNNPDTPDTPQATPQRTPRLTEGLGSGIIVEKKGDVYYAVTNNHVAGNAQDITVILQDKREFKGTLVGTDTRRDIAVVSFAPKDSTIPLARLGDSDAIKVGDWAIAVGNPLGLAFSVTTGTISALSRDGGPEDNISDFIQTDASINQGNSGGALANIDGEVVGINTWIASPTGGSIGLGFAIPINNVKKSVRDIIDKKEVKYGWLGVRPIDGDASFLRSIGVDGKKGTFIEQVFQDSPADKAGILPGDFIISIDGKEITNSTDLTRRVGDTIAGAKVEMGLIRSGSTKKLSVKIDERDDKKINDNSKLWPGIQVLPSDSPLLANAGMKVASGVVVQSVIAKSPAADMGLQARDVITEINGKKVSSLRDFYEAMNSTAAKLVFKYSRNDKDFESPAYIKKK